jgi:hypothetical protein
MFANAENIQNKLVLKLWSIRRNIRHTKAKKSTTTNHKGKKWGPLSTEIELRQQQPKNNT